MKKAYHGKLLLLAATISIVLPSMARADNTKCYVYIAGACPTVPQVPVNAWFEDFGADNDNVVCIHRAKDFLAQCGLIGRPGAAAVAGFALNGRFVNGQYVVAGQSYTYGLDFSGWRPLDTK
jgi:hypothetical protein